MRTKRPLYRIHIPCLSQCLLTAGFCLFLGACSTLGLGNNKADASVSGSASGSSTPTATQETPPQTTMEASYRKSPHRNTVIDLPDAMNYPVEDHRIPVDDLDIAPEWMPTPLDEIQPTQREAPPIVEGTPEDENIMRWVDDMSRASLKQAIRKQLRVMEQRDLTQRVRIGNRWVSRQHLMDTLTAFLDLLNEDLPEEKFNKRLNEEFEIVVAGYPRKNRPVVFTGYYTPIIPARREKTQDYIYPLYQKPEWYPAQRVNLPSGGTSFINQGFHSPPAPTKALLTRKDIDGKNALHNQNLELAWLNDNLERYFLHIQGSGYLAFPDGTLQAVHYMGSNHFPYRSIGRQMIDDGVIEPGQGSMQGIKQYFREHPEDIDKYLFRNNRYIFFKMSNSMPRGSGGAELVPGRSIATDKSLYAAGGLAFITVQVPVLNDDLEITGWKQISRFVVDQDTGSAIKGPGRVDLYFGVGKAAGAAAGHYKRTGTMIYLLKK